jgi:hypothetical protein
MAEFWVFMRAILIDAWRLHNGIPPSLCFQKLFFSGNVFSRGQASLNHEKRIRKEETNNELRGEFELVDCFRSIPRSLVGFLHVWRCWWCVEPLIFLPVMLKRKTSLEHNRPSFSLSFLRDRVSHYEVSPERNRRGNKKDKEHNIRPTNELSLVTSIDKLTLSSHSQALVLLVHRTQHVGAGRGVVWILIYLIQIINKKRDADLLSAGCLFDWRRKSCNNSAELMALFKYRFLWCS